MTLLEVLPAVGSGSLVGFTLGLVGGGGSILATPLLLYVVGVANPHVAIGTSALAVSVNAFANLASHAHKGHVRWRCAAVFAAVGTLGTILGSSLGLVVDGRHLLFLFGLVMVVVGLLMLLPRKSAAWRSASGRPPHVHRHRRARAGHRRGVGLLRHRRRLPHRAGPDLRHRHAGHQCGRLLAARRRRLRAGDRAQLCQRRPGRLGGRRRVHCRRRRRRFPRHAARNPPLHPQDRAQPHLRNAGASPSPPTSSRAICRAGRGRQPTRPRRQWMRSEPGAHRSKPRGQRPEPPAQQVRRLSD